MMPPPPVRGLAYLLFSSHHRSLRRNPVHFLGRQAVQTKSFVQPSWQHRAARAASLAYMSSDDLSPYPSPEQQCHTPRRSRSYLPRLLPAEVEQYREIYEAYLSEEAAFSSTPQLDDRAPHGTQTAKYVRKLWDVLARLQPKFTQASGLDMSESTGESQTSPLQRKCSLEKSLDDFTSDGSGDTDTPVLTEEQFLVSCLLKRTTGVVRVWGGFETPGTVRQLRRCLATSFGHYAHSVRSCYMGFPCRVAV